MTAERARGPRPPGWAVLAALAAVACSDSSERAAPVSPPDKPRPIDDGDALDTPADGSLPIGKILPLPEEPHWYRVAMRHISRAGDDSLEEIPFFVWIPPGDDDTRAVIANGEQRFQARRRWSGDSVVIEFPLYHTRLYLKRYSDGVYRGQWDVASPTWGTASLPLRATFIGDLTPSQRFLPPPDHDDSQPPIDPSGSWYVTFDKSRPAQLVIAQQSPGVITGVFHFTTGDMVYTAGNVLGDQIYLSGFDATSPFLVIATFDPALSGLQGTWFGAPDLGWRESLLGYRDARDITVDTPKLALGQDELHLPELSTDRYRDRPVVVELSGSWCTACNNAVPVLRALYEKYHPHGLEMLTYTYEFTNDAEYNQQQARAFVKEYEVPWEVRAINGTIDNFWELMPIEITDFNDTSFPIVIFLNGDASIYDIHAGFPGPEAGDAHRRVVAKYDRRIRALLRAGTETAPSGTPRAPQIPR